MNFKGKMYEKSGITLIGLVVTIIVLLILAGVSIATLTGENGILTRAQEAKNKTEQAQKDEENILNSYEDKINGYAGIDWDTVLANAQKHPDQVTSTAIGVGTDGKPVNMDLWEYTKLDDGTYALNNEEAYKGKIVDGKIEGTIPQYIKDESDEGFVTITSLQQLFYQNTELTQIPILPDTVTNIRDTFKKCTGLTIVDKLPNNIVDMQGTFYDCANLQEVKNLPSNLENLNYTFRNCTNLTSIGKIPDNVTNMQSAFEGCTALTTAPMIGNSVINMQNTFRNCTSLITVSEIPDSVTDMQYTFAGCESLKTAPEIPDSVTNMQYTFKECTNLTTVLEIPNSVTNMINTFIGCTNLQGEIIINANLTGAIIGDYVDYTGVLWNACKAEGITLKVLGSCPVLQEIVSNANNPNIKL